MDSRQIFVGLTVRNLFRFPDNTIFVIKIKKSLIRRIMRKESYTPAPLDTSGEVLPEALTPLVEALAKNVHEVWAQSRLAEGWRYGERRDNVAKTHPCLVPYEELPEIEKAYDRNTALGTLRSIQAAGFEIVKRK